MVAKTSTGTANKDEDGDLLNRKHIQPTNKEAKMTGQIASARMHCRV